MWFSSLFFFHTPSNKIACEIIIQGTIELRVILDLTIYFVAVGFIEGGNWGNLPTFICSHGQNLSYKFNLVHLNAYQNQTHNLVSKGTEYNYR